MILVGMADSAGFRHPGERAPDSPISAICWSLKTVPNV